MYVTEAMHVIGIGCLCIYSVRGIRGNSAGYLQRVQIKPLMSLIVEILPIRSRNPGRFAPKPFPPLVVSPPRRFPPGRFAPTSRFAPLVASPP